MIFSLLMRIGVIVLHCVVLLPQIEYVIWIFFFLCIVLALDTQLAEANKRGSTKD